MKKIFWLEDTDQSFKDFSFMLEDYEIYHVKDYKQAITAINEGKFDLYVVDIIVPSGKTGATLSDLTKYIHTYFGLEFIKHVRSNKDYTPILALTVVRDNATRESIKHIDPDIEILWKYDNDAEAVKLTIDSMIASSRDAGQRKAREKDPTL